MTERKHVLLYGLLGGALIALLKLIEYRYLVVEHSVEIYGGLIAAVFAATGIWLGLKLTRPRERVVVREVPVPAPATFTLNEQKLDQLGITPRELEILGLIAEGRSNGSIATSLGITKRAVERHINAIFLKLDLGRAEDVSRRVKAALLYLGGDEL